MSDLIKGFVLGCVVGPVIASLIYFFWIKPAPVNETCQYLLGEAVQVGSLALIDQPYSETCRLRDDAYFNLSWGEASFTWEQMLGFGVELDGSPPKLELEANGVYTLYLPPLKQLYDFERGFSDISFPDTVFVAVHNALVDADGLRFDEKINRLSKAINDRYKDGGLRKHFGSVFRMPTAAELNRMKTEARKVANKRTEKVIKMIIESDQLLEGVNPENRAQRSLRAEAAEAARVIFKPLIEDSLKEQLQKDTDLMVGDKEATELTELKVVFGNGNELNVGQESSVEVYKSYLNCSATQ